jgi:hypothetical protein
LNIRARERYPLAAERHAFGLQQPALPLALGKRSVGPHDPVPGDARVVADGEDRAGEARRAGGDVAVGADEALWGVADPAQDGLLALAHPGIVARP